jgi:hypothetical protein
MAISWKLLDLGRLADAHMPPLLISKSFEADSYTIHLTDLTHIWSESLDHDGIVGRAEEESTSIDPSDSSQLQILLEKLGLALSSGPNTTLSLHIPSSPGRARPIISLNLTIKLPGGLAPLVWPIHLSAAPQSVLTSQLTVPLLLAQHARVSEIEGLKEVVREKDHVIQKLLDRLETQGTDVGQVFPQATGRGGRKVDRKQAEEKVRGLGPFDMEAWRKRLGGERIQDRGQLVENVFTGDSTFDLGTESSVGPANWWDAIKGSTIDLSNSKAVNKTTPKLTLKHQESTEDNDDFQVQATLPHLASTPKTSRSVALDDFTDDEDLDFPSQLSESSKLAKRVGKIGGKKVSKNLSPSWDDSTEDEEAPAPKPTQKFGKIGGRKDTPAPTKDNSTDDDEPVLPKSAKKFGRIGGRIQARKEPSPPVDDSTDDSEAGAPKTAKKFARIGGKKEVEPAKSSSPPPPAEDETTDDEEAPPPRERSSSKSSSPEPAARPKWGLGKIGGGKKAPSPSPSAPSSDEAPQPKKGKLGQIGGKKKESPPTPHSSQQSETPAKRKLGAIGGRNKNSHEENAAIETGEQGRGRLLKVEKDKTPQPRETSGERAERKRRELKRELEEKAKAPVKKKRKF